MKSVIKWIVLALCLTGCSAVMDKVEETNQVDQPTINNVENIDEDEKSSINKNNETVSFSESNQEENIKTEEKVVKVESNDNNQTNIKQSNDSKKENNKNQTTDEKKTDNVKVDDKQDNQQKEQEVTKPVETPPEVPKEEQIVPKEEEKKEEIVIKAYLSHDTLNYINKEREKIGLSPLKWDSSLENAILTKAKETEQNYSHTRPNGSKWSTVLPNKDSMQLYGEIITNRFSPYDAVQAWMNSPSHKESMLDPDKTHGVVAIYNDVYVCITVKYFD